MDFRIRAESKALIATEAIVWFILRLRYCFSQDAKLVDIEDLTRRLKQMAFSVKGVPPSSSSIKTKNSTKKTKK